MLYLVWLAWHSHNSDNVKSNGGIDVIILHKTIGSRANTPGLTPVNSLLRIHKQVVPTCLYLHNHQHVVHIADNIKVTMPVAPVALQYPHSLVGQIVGGYLLAPRYQFIVLCHSYLSFFCTAHTWCVFRSRRHTISSPTKIQHFCQSPKLLR